MKSRMEVQGRGRGRRVLAISIALIGHVLLLWLFSQGGNIPRVTDASERSSTLFFIDPPSALSPAPPSASVPFTAIDLSPPVLVEPEEPATTTTEPSSNAPRMIDWQGEAQRAASSVVEANQTPGPRGFGPAESDAVAPKEHEFEWNPEPKKAGFIGVLPYLRLGKRCIVGLGFFGCALGDPPPANGDLFEGMDDPDRDRSSVPDPARVR